MNFWETVLLEPTKTAMTQISGFLTKILAALIILFIGWLISRAIKLIVVKVLNAVKINVLADRIELSDALEKGGIKYTLADLIGVICYWLAILVTLMVAFNAIGLSVAADMMNKVILYVPNIIVALFVLIVGMFIAVLLGNVVNTATSNAGLSQSGLLSRLVKAIVMVFVVAIALEQLNIGARTIELTISIILATVLGSIGLGIALAFGFGCRDIAARYVEDIINKLKKK